MCYNFYMKTYFQHKLENLISVNKIITIHYFEFEKNFQTAGEAHDFWEIVYAERESLLCTADGQEIFLAQGEILFHKPNEFHTLAANGKTAPNVFILSFVCKSESMKFFENKKFPLSAHLAKFLYSIWEEGKKTFDIPYSDPNLKKMKLLPYPTLGGEQLIKNYLEIFLINLLSAESCTLSTSICAISSLFWRSTSRFVATSDIWLMFEKITGYTTIMEMLRKM